MYISVVRGVTLVRVRLDVFVTSQRPNEDVRISVHAASAVTCAFRVSLRHPSAVTRAFRVSLRLPIAVPIVPIALSLHLVQ